MSCRKSYSSFMIFFSSCSFLKTLKLIIFPLKDPLAQQHTFLVFDFSLSKNCCLNKIIGPMSDEKFITSISMDHYYHNIPHISHQSST